MELPAVGRVENPDELDIEPIVIPIVGYTRNRKEVVEKIRFRSHMPAGATFDVMRHMNADGGVQAREVLRYLDATVLEEDSEKLQEFIHRPDVEIRLRTMIEVHEALMEAYAARPTTQLPGSTGTGSSTKRTSRAASRAKASRSKQSRSPSRST